MADVSDPRIKDSYADVRNDKTETNWAVFKYEGKKKIVFAAKGNGDLSELAEQFNDDEAAFAFLRVTTGDEESKRAKFVLVSWCGEKVGALARANMSVHKASVKDICRDFVSRLRRCRLPPSPPLLTQSRAGPRASLHRQGRDRCGRPAGRRHQGRRRRVRQRSARVNSDRNRQHAKYLKKNGSFRKPQKKQV